MQMSIVKSASRFEAKLLVSSALSEMIEDEKLDRLEIEEFEYDELMHTLAADPYHFDDLEFYSDEPDYQHYYDDDHYDPFEDYFYDYDLYPSYYVQPLTPVAQEGQSLGDILEKCLANRS